MWKYRFIIGGFIGALFTAALIATLYLGDQWLALPFVPYDLFDWLTRTLPGDVITKAIDTIVSLISDLDLGETSSTAKRLENIGGVMTALGIGAGAGAVLFAGLGRMGEQLDGWLRYLPGVLVALVIGVPAMLISRHILYSGGEEFADLAPESTSMLWLLVAFLVWGLALTWAYWRLYPEPGMAGYVPARAPEPARDAMSSPDTPAPIVSAEAINRREFLIKVGGATATLTVIGAGIGRWIEYREEQDYQDLIQRRRDQAANMPTSLPNSGDPLQPAPGTRPEYTPLEDHYRIDINSRPPELDGEAWRLRVGGLVDRPLELTLDELRDNYDPLHQYVTLACISNPIAGDLTSTTRWTGTTLRDVLRDAGVQSGATHLKITSADGFYETVALDVVNDDERVMLTYNWDGIPLLYKHGFPLRIYIPDRYGMKQPKWITDIEAIAGDEDGYWVVRGWDKEARMRATSVVDVVANDATITDDAGGVLVPVGGIAHAGARGISAVEVKVDDGEWVPAELRSPLSETTWVIWRYDWPFEAGRHSFAVRCVEGDGTPQIAESNPNRPSGATGIHRLTRTV